MAMAPDDVGQENDATLKSAAEAGNFIRLQLAATGRPAFRACQRVHIQVKMYAWDPLPVLLLPGLLAAAAPGYMPNLRTLILSMDREAVRAQTAWEPEARDCMLAGLISPIIGLQQLRVLELDGLELGSCTLAIVGSLTQITDLVLNGVVSAKQLAEQEDPEEPEEQEQLDLAPLSGMTQLVELVVANTPITPKPPTAAAGQFCLPSSLQRLEVESDQGTPWLQHLAGCPQLRELTMRMAKGNAGGVLELVARHTPKLQELVVWHLSDDEEPSDEPSDEPSKGPSKGPAGVLPRDMVVMLTHLRHLHLPKYMVETAGDWEALGRLQALTCLINIWASCAPPQGWQHTGIKVLKDMRVPEASPQVAVRVLAALPALQEADIEVECDLRLMPQAANAAVEGIDQAGLVSGLQASPHLTRLFFASDMGDRWAYLAPIMAAAGSSLLELNVDMGNSSRPQLPDLSACTALTSLAFGQPEDADVGDLVGLVQPLARTLRELVVREWGRITPAAAKVLQHVLPCLSSVGFPRCGSRLREQKMSEEQLRRLQQQLRPGLTLLDAEP